MKTFQKRSVVIHLSLYYVTDIRLIIENKSRPKLQICTLLRAKLRYLVPTDS